MPPESFDIDYLDEPQIEFNGDKDSSPKRGLLRFGPRLKGGEHQSISVGVIGDRDSISNLRSLFSEMELAIVPQGADAEEESELTPSHIPFPGTGEDSDLNVSINAHPNWQRIVSETDLTAISNQSTVDEKMQEFLDKVDDEMYFLKRLDPQPDIVIVCIPQTVMDECTPDDEDYAEVKSSEEGHDLHNQVKILGMKRDLPTQLVKPDTLRPSNDQERASRAWNLTVGMLYKAQRGHPWKTKDMDPGTCYAGIVFYKQKDTEENVVRAALAHVFMRGDHNIIQSESMQNLEEDENGKPHLSFDEANSIAEQIIKFYELNHNGAAPNRLVLHKSSEFWEDERDGFKKAAETAGVPVKDFVRIRPRTDVRLLPPGEFPTLRGTLLSVPRDDTHYLYTTGYVPEMVTWRGSGIPEPVEIKPDEVCRTPSRELCEEVMFLTKLDWNTSEFSVKEPVTTGVARKVGDVLSEVDLKTAADDIEVQYFWYM